MDTAGGGASTSVHQKRRRGTYSDDYYDDDEDRREDYRDDSEDPRTGQPEITSLKKVTVRRSSWDQCDLYLVASFGNLCTQVQERWPELQIADYGFQLWLSADGGQFLTTVESVADWRHLLTGVQQAGMRSWYLLIVEDGIELESLTGRRGADYGMLGCPLGLELMRVGDFPTLALDEVQRALLNRVVADIVRQIHRLDATLGWHERVNDPSILRQYIMCVLIALVEFAGEVEKDEHGEPRPLRLRVDECLMGRCTAGPVHFMAFYLGHSLMSVMLEEKLDFAFAPAVGVVAAARDMTAARLREARREAVANRKPKFWEEGGLEGLDTVAIATTGDRWRLLRYESRTEGVLPCRFLLGPLLQLGIFGCADEALLRGQVESLVLVAAQGLLKQMAHIDGSAALRALR